MKKLLMSLLLVSGGFVGLVRGAEQEAQEELVDQQEKRKSVPSLQFLCLKRLFAEKTEEEAKKVLKNLPEYFRAESGDAYVSQEILKIAVEEYKKNENSRTLPLKIYKKANPGFGLLLEKGTFVYSLSIQDLINAKVAVQLKYGCLCFNSLGITSLDGLQDINLPAARELNLNNNKIREIVPGVFDNLPVLEKLTLSRNQIREIVPGVFVGLPALKTLFLAANQIEQIAPEVLAELPVQISIFYKW